MTLLHFPTVETVGYFMPSLPGLKQLPARNSSVTPNPLTESNAFSEGRGKEQSQIPYSSEYLPCRCFTSGS